MLATSKNVLFPGHNHLLATCTDDPSISEAIMVVTWWVVAFLHSDNRECNPEYAYKFHV